MKRRLLLGAAATSAMVLRRSLSLAQVPPQVGLSMATTVLLASNRRKICAVGDSYMGSNTNNVTPAPVNGYGGNNITINGALSCLNAIAGWPWLFNNNDNFATSGGTLTNVIGHLPAILAGGYSICFVQGCHNDFLNGYLLNSGPNNVVSNYKYIINTLLSAGILPVIILGCPINSNEGSTYVTLDQVRKMNLEANVWKRNYCQSLGIPVWDWATPMSDLTASSVGAYGVNMSGDGIHPSGLACYMAAQQGLIDLAPIIPPPMKSGFLQSTPEDVFDATSNPYGNILNNGGLFWSGGGTAASGSSGTVGVGYTFQNVGSGPTTPASRVASLVASADGIGQWQQLSFSGTTTGGTTTEAWQLYQFINQGSVYSPGDVVEAGIEFSISANSPFAQFYLYLTEQNKDNSQATNGTGWQSGAPYLPLTAWSGTLRTAPLTIPPNSATGSSNRILYPQLKVQFDNSANNFSGTIAWRRFTVRKVPQF